MLLTIAFFHTINTHLGTTQPKLNREVLQFYSVISTFCDFVHRRYFKAKANGVV